MVLVLVAVEGGLMAEQPLVAHSRKRWLARDAANEGDQGRDKRPPENRVTEDSPAGAVRKREAFDACGHDSSFLLSTSVPAKSCVLYSGFCEMRSVARREPPLMGRPGSSVGRAHD